MRIYEVGQKDSLKTAFKSLRKDKHIVAQLVQGKIPLIENNKRNIYTAMNNLAADADRNNIEFLLYVAENLAYGQGHNSKFKDILDKDAITPERRENTDWTLLLEDTVRKSLSASKEDVDDLIDDYKRIFSDKKDLTPEQKNILRLRREITTNILNNYNPQNEEDLMRVTDVRENLDYFIASSEIPLIQKQESLEKLSYFMSDEYKINPQLEGKKLQILDEMLNDLVVKTPNDDVLKTKGVNQRQSGICAAISICRKDMAYEDKTKYIDLILQELNDSDVMSVYDITELGTGKKVEIPKTPVNYNSAIVRGYRIIDASAHQWMHNAHASGDGTLQTEFYIPFDEENYGLFNDSSWYSNPEESKHEEKELLRALIKEREAIESFSKTAKQMKETNESIHSVQQDVFLAQKKASAKLHSIFSSIFPNKSDSEITGLKKALYKFYKGSNNENEVNVPSKLPQEVKQNILVQFIEDITPEISEQEKASLREKAPAIYNMTDMYVNADKDLAGLKKYKSARSKYIYNKKLFNIAAAHRVAMERDVNMADGVARFESLVGLPPRDIQISNYLRTLRNSLSSQSVRAKFPDKQGNIPSAKRLEKELATDTLKIETIIPKKIDSIFETLLDKNVTEMVADMYSQIGESIKNGDSDALQNIKMTMNINDDKKGVLKKIKNWEVKLSNSPSNEDVLQAIRLLGYDDRMHISVAFMQAYIQGLQAGISEDQFNRLIKIFGGANKISDGIEMCRNKFNKQTTQYMNLLDKWHVPSAREQIIERLESQHNILSRKQLDKLNHKFLSIQAGTIANEKIENSKERSKANQKWYTFYEDENELFASIERKIPSMRKYANMQYNNLNDLLFHDLENTYADIGMLNGQFWVREEGSSGLAANEQIRIIEQMTGKPYHIETNINNAAKEIKSGKNSGIISMSVMDDDYAFHAQYIPAITTETFTDPISGKKEEQDIVWTDNSWGNAEKDSFWNGRNGFEYTDYGNGYGWKNGFVIDKERKIGLPLKDIHGAMGYSKEDDEKFGLFTDVILQGSPVNVYQKLYKVFNYIFNMDEGVKFLNALENQIKTTGYKFSIKELEGIDDIASAQVDKLSKRIEKEINSEEDFNKLPDDDPLKFAFQKLAVYLSTDNPTLAMNVTSVSTPEELKEITDSIFEEHLNTISTLLTKTDDSLEMLHSLSKNEFNKLFGEMKDKFGKSFSPEEQEMMLNGIFYDQDALSKHDGTFTGLENLLMNQTVSVAIKNIKEEEPLKFFIENAQNILTKNLNDNMKIKSLNETILHNSPLYKELIDAVDKYLEPKDDNELLQLIQGLQMASYDKTNEFLNVLEPEDVGIRNQKPYDCLLQYKAGNRTVHKAFYEIISANEIDKNMKPSDNPDASTPEEYYRAIMVKLSEMDVQKYIKGFKEEAFQKYKVRQAFPDPVVLPDDEIEISVRRVLDALKGRVDSISSNKFVLNILDKFEKINTNYVYTPEFQNEINKEKIIFTDENTDMLVGFVNSVTDLYQLTSQDNSIRMISEPLYKIMSAFSTPTSPIDSKTVSEAINELNNVYSDMKDSGVSKSRFIELNKEELATLKSEIKLSVNANIEPKYRDKAFSMFNNILEMHRKHAPQEDIQNLEDDLTDLFVERHIVKNPTVLLKEAVKLLMDGKHDTSEYAVMHDYLVQALQVAQQTKIQYKLVQNQHEGISSKTKDVLPLFNVTMLDGTSQDMDSETGMLYLVEKLKNTGDNYKILNLFLQQSGLSNRTLKALINTFEIDKTDALITDKANEVSDDISNLDELAKHIDNYRNSDKTNYPTVEKAMQSLSSYIKRIKPNHEDEPVYKKFLYYVDSLQYSGTMDDASETLKKSLISQITTDALQYVADMVNEEMKYISEVGKFIEERMQLIMSVNVPVNSEEYQHRLDFINRYKETEALIGKKMQAIMEQAKNSEFMNPREEE